MVIHHRYNRQSSCTHGGFRNRSVWCIGQYCAEIYTRVVWWWIMEVAFTMWMAKCRIAVDPCTHNCNSSITHIYSCCQTYESTKQDRNCYWWRGFSCGINIEQRSFGRLWTIDSNEWNRGRWSCNDNCTTKTHTEQSYARITRGTYRFFLDCEALILIY